MFEEEWRRSKNKLETRYIIIPLDSSIFIFDPHRRLAKGCQAAPYLHQVCIHESCKTMQNAFLPKHILTCEIMWISKHHGHHPCPYCLISRARGEDYAVAISGLAYNLCASLGYEEPWVRCARTTKEGHAQQHTFDEMTVHISSYIIYIYILYIYIYIYIYIIYIYYIYILYILYIYHIFTHTYTDIYIYTHYLVFGLWQGNLYCSNTGLLQQSVRTQPWHWEDEDELEEVCETW